MSFSSVFFSQILIYETDGAPSGCCGEDDKEDQRCFVEFVTEPELDGPTPNMR